MLIWLLIVEVLLILLGCVIIYSLPAQNQTLGNAFGVQVSDRGTLKFVRSVVYFILFVIIVFNILYQVLR